MGLYTALICALYISFTIYESALKCSKRIIKVSPQHGYTGNGGRQRCDGHLTDTDDYNM